MGKWSINFTSAAFINIMEFITVVILYQIIYSLTILIIHIGRGISMEGSASGGMF